MNCKLRNAIILFAFCLAVVWSMPSWGQVLKGSISGTVKDPQGAVVSGAQVKATNTGTGNISNTTTDGSGSFHFSLMPVGAYKVEATKQGFNTSVDSSVQVSAGVDTSVPIGLAVGETGVTVEVTSEAPLVETTQAQVTNVFAGAALATFAGVQENQGLDNLALFVPGVVASRDIGFSNTNGGGGFSTNGLRGRNNDQEIDGQNNNDNSIGGPGLFVADPEFVQQYVLITDNFGPEYGRNSGSVVNIITRTGTNNWHGSIYGDEGNSILNSLANTDKRFNGLTQPPRNNNEFTGFTIGGPWIKNKVFFFGGFNDQIVSTTVPFTSQALSPTPAGLATLNGCFPGQASLAAWGKFGPYGVTGGNPHPITVPLNPADPNSPKGFVPINIDGCDNVQFGGVSRTLPQPVHQFNWVAKNDITLGNDSITSRYIFNRGNFFNLDFGDAAAGYPVNVPALSQAVLESWTHNFGSHMVNEARVSFNRLNVDFGGNTIGTVPTADQLDQSVTRVTFRFQSNFSTPGSAAGALFPTLPFLAIGPATNLPQARIVNTWQLQDNWTYVRGKHTVKAGVNFTYQRSPNIFLPNVNGSFRFDCWDNCIGGGGFDTNNPDRVTVAKGPTSLDFREYDTFLYVGDDWKIKNNLTLNLGLTWTYYGQPENLFNSITTKRESNPATAFWSATEPVGNPPGSGGPFLNPGAAIPLSARTLPQIPAVNNSFGPSVGFAYSPQWGGFITGHGKTVLRGGYRLLYDPPYYNIYTNESTSAPFVFLQTFRGAAAASKGVPANATGPGVRNSLNPFLTPGAFDPRTFNQTNITPNFGPDKVHSYSFGFEREVSKSSAFEARYVGNQGRNLFQNVNGNPFFGTLATQFPNLVPAGLTPCPASQAFSPIAVGRLNCNEGLVDTRSNGGYSSYNSLQTEFRANNLFNQLTIRTSYTYSKTLDNVSEIFSTFGAGNSISLAQNPLNTTTGEHSFSGLDIPHQWTILFAESLPFYKDQHGVIGHLLGGWTFSANYILASGQRYTPDASFVNQVTAPNFSDNAFIGNFLGVDIARPFIGNLSAPATTVGIFAKDACGSFGVGCGGVDSKGNPVTPSTLLSMNAINNPTPFLPLSAITVSTTKDAVRFIINGGEAETIFGTPFGNAPRNIATDAITNVANASVFKRFKITERASFEFHATALNALNHNNFNTVDPFVEDAGSRTSGTGFGDPSLTGSVPPGFIVAANRQFLFGGKFTF